MPIFGTALPSWRRKRRAARSPRSRSAAVDPAEAAGRLEFARLRAVLLALALAARAPEHRIESAGRSTASERLGLLQMRQRSSGFATPPISAARRSSAIMSMSGRARPIAAMMARMSAALADAAKDRVIGGKLPLAWRPPMKRATRNGPLRTTSSAIDKAGCPPCASVAMTIVGLTFGDPVADPDRALRRRVDAPSAASDA